MQTLRKFAALAATLTIACTITSVQAKTWDKITVATEGNYAPWNFTNSSGKLEGYEIDLTAELCKRMNAQCTIVAQDWDGIIPGLNAGKYDAIIASMGVTAAREKAVAFSVPYAKAPNGFIAMKSNSLSKLPDLSKLFDLTQDEGAAKTELEKLAPLLKGKVVGVQGGSTAAAFADKYLKPLLDVREYKTHEASVLDLASGRIDLVMSNITVLQKSLSQPDMANATFTGPRFTGGVVGHGTANVAIRKTDTDLQDKFNSAIKSVNEDGTNLRLMKKWFGLDLLP
ncbi:transporter substrate-binding domain-containing protein [Paraburkholderia sp. J8-2]|uniref:transporter substrate-binding domain-containing protein n=1 Tax=Paraburkholderia sp. J8-2 TaxID=2805440 RepID=UPI002AB73891|nr:transporter substrate-binding domain-containing protein [Paraburkholderia sp. J8-2]